MPVFEQGYETYGGTRRPLAARWWPLFREEALPFVKRRLFIFLLVIALIPWGWGVLLTFFHTQLGDSESVKSFVNNLPQVDETLFAVLLTNFYNLFLLLLVAIWVGSGLVARDRKEGTLEVFLGRAVSPLQYLWAKGAALGVFMLLFSLLPTIVLVVFQVGLTGDPGWLWEHSRVLWGTLLYTIVGPGTLVLVMLALSSLSRSPRMVGLTFFGIAFLGPIFCGILYGITRSPLAWFPSVMTQLKILAYRCLGAELEEHFALHPALTVAFFLLLILGSLGVLAWRFKNRGVLR